MVSTLKIKAWVGQTPSGVHPPVRTAGEHVLMACDAAERVFALPLNTRQHELLLGSQLRIEMLANAAAIQNPDKPRSPHGLNEELFGSFVELLEHTGFFSGNQGKFLATEFYRLEFHHVVHQCDAYKISLDSLVVQTLKTFPGFACASRLHAEELRDVE